VTLGERQVTYGTYLMEDMASDAQGRWRLTHRLPGDDPLAPVREPASEDKIVYGSDSDKHARDELQID
jgi:hypothetical protein